MKKPESKRQKNIRAALEKMYQGCFIVKIWGGPFQAAGIPDLLCCINGIFIGIEVKVGGNEASEIQADTIDEIIASGGYAAVAYTEEEAIDVAEAALEASKGGRKFRVNSAKRLPKYGTGNRENVIDLGYYRNKTLPRTNRHSEDSVPRKRRRGLA